MKVKDILSKIGLKSLSKIGVSAVLVLAGRRVLFLLIGVFVLISLWLLYDNVWYELQQEVGLPESVVGSGVLEINVEALKSINTRRPDQVEHILRNYQVYNRLFTVPTEISL